MSFYDLPFFFTHSLMLKHQRGVSPITSFILCPFPHNFAFGKSSCSWRNLIAASSSQTVSQSLTEAHFR
uniref:Ovule protein n=1 Tax=Strongyloides venezuelensis TaxID=75913 RepID=A0A0K0G3R0_STRVS